MYSCAVLPGAARVVHASPPLQPRTQPLGFRSRYLVCKAKAANETLGFKTMRTGIKEAADDTVLTPRFYTTDFDEMERLFSLELNPHLDMSEIEACLREFRTDYNQTHFVRNDSFKRAADNVEGQTRKIFIEFLERSCTAEFSGFLLYKELGRRLKSTNPAVAEIFSLMVGMCTLCSLRLALTACSYCLLQVWVQRNHLASLLSIARFTDIFLCAAEPG